MPIASIPPLFALVRQSSQFENGTIVAEACHIPCAHDALIDSNRRDVLALCRRALIEPIHATGWKVER